MLRDSHANAAPDEPAPGPGKRKGAHKKKHARTVLDRPPVRMRATQGRIRAVFVVEPDEGALLANMRSRERRIAHWSEEELQLDARAMWLYGQWLAGEARRYAAPVVESRPWTTLADRIVEAITVAPT